MERDVDVWGSVDKTNRLMVYYPFCCVLQLSVCTMDCHTARATHGTRDAVRHVAATTPRQTTTPVTTGLSFFVLVIYGELIELSHLPITKMLKNLNKTTISNPNIHQSLSYRINDISGFLPNMSFLTFSNLIKLVKGIFK